MASRRPLTLGFKWLCRLIAAALGSCVFLLGTAPAHGLDPNKHLTQYIHTTWRMQDGSAPAAMFSITQTSDGFLWFSAIPQGVYRFDGVQFLPRFLNTNIVSMHIGNVFADQASGLWAIGDHEIAHIKDGGVIAHFELEGIGGRSGITRDSDGSRRFATLLTKP